MKFDGATYEEQVINAVRKNRPDVIFRIVDGYKGRAIQWEVNGRKNAMRIGSQLMPMVPAEKAAALITKAIENT